MLRKSRGRSSVGSVRTTNRSARRQGLIEALEDRKLLSVSILNGGGAGYVGNGGGGPPDVTGCAGPSSYVESSNSRLAIYPNKDTGASAVTASPGTFFFTTGGLTQVTPTSQRIADVTMVYDNLMGDGRFIIGNLDADLTANQSQFVFAVSTSNDPTTFTTADWNFYQVNTTEGSGSSTSWSDYPGNPGFNADAFVVTFNMFGSGPTGTQVVSIDAGDLLAGNALVISGAGQNVFRNDVPGGARNYRPTAMHDAAPGDPMWLIHDPGTGNSLSVVGMTGVLSSSASFPTTTLPLPAAANFIASGGIGDPLNPDGSEAVDGDDESGEFPENPDGGGSFDPGARILKAGEFNNTIVAAHTVAVDSGVPYTLASAQPNDKNGKPLGGSGYAVGDTLTVTGGTFTTAAQLTVQTVNGTGGITAATVATPGSYSSLSGVTGGVSGGTGSGATFSLFFTGELAAQWYAIDVSGGAPAFQQVGGSDNVGRIAYGANTYAFEPGVDINSEGDIGLGFMQSDTVGGAADSATGGFISTFVTARRPTDAAGTMQTPILVPAGTGTANINGRIGDFSGLSYDPADNTFWAVNEFGGGGPTVIANFAPALGLGGASENVTLRVNPLDFSKVQVLVTGTSTVIDTFDNNSTSLYAITGDANDNALTFDESFGVINTPVSFDGGGATGALGDRVLVIGNSADDTLTLSPTGNTAADISFDGSRTYSVRNIQKFSFGGDAGNDTMVLDSGGGLLSLDKGIAYDGGTGFDKLQLIQTGGPARISDVCSVGPLPGDGTSVITGSSATQTVSFQNLEPVLDLVPAATLTVNATPENNVINYTQGAAVTNGKVTVDNSESIEFSGKSTVVVNAGVGNDLVNLNNAVTPTGLGLLAVNGAEGDDVVTTLSAVAVPLSLSGGAGNDTLSASGAIATAAATLDGGDGRDVLTGGAGGDTLTGGSGEDLLDGRGGTNTVNGGADGDTILVSGTSGADSIGVTHSAATLTVTGGLSAGTNTISNVEAVRVEAGSGSDGVTLTPSTGLSYTVLGSDPIGAPGDLLTVVSGTAVTYTPGPESDSGSLNTATAAISFDEIEAISISGAPAIVNGTNAPDAITVIARDSSTHAGADGVQDFTVSINASPSLLFLNTAALTINSLGGSDEVVLRTPAPNNADWNVGVTVDGGPPASAAPDGDRMIVETPGAAPETVSFSPTAPDGGSLVIVEAVAAQATTVAITGLETLAYNGQGDNDALTVYGTVGDDAFSHSPGAANDAGSLGVVGLLGVSYSGLGAGASLTANGGGGVDTLTYDGTSGNDAFTVDSAAGAGTVRLNARLVLSTPNVEALTTQGLAGDDAFTLVPALSLSPYANINFRGGGQASAAGDRANLVGRAADDTFAMSGSALSQGGKTVDAAGVEDLRLDAGLGLNDIIYTGVVGVSEAINVQGSQTANAGRVVVPGLAALSFANVQLVEVNGNNGSGTDTDTLTFDGTNVADVVVINAEAAGTNASPVLKLLNSAGTATLLTLRNYSLFNTLNVRTFDGADDVRVYTGPTRGRNISVDGGIPLGKNKLTDLLTIYYTGNRPRIVQSAATQNPDSGLVNLDYGTSLTLVQYTSMELVVIKKL